MKPTVSILVLAAALAVPTLFAAPAAATNAVDLTKKPVTAAEKAARKAYLQQRFLEHTGGKILRPGTRKGEIVYVDCQKRAPRAILEESRAYFTEVSRMNIVIREGAFSFPNPAIQGNASLFVVDDPALPPFLVAPESRWALVNVAQLAQGRGEKPAFFEARVRKELTRGFSALCGAMNSGYPGAITGGVAETAALDRFTDAQLPVDVIARFAPYMGPFGVTPAIYDTYRKACREGWAPSPTNDVQKRIWAEVHTLPTKPLKLQK